MNKNYNFGWIKIVKIDEEEIIAAYGAEVAPSPVRVAPAPVMVAPAPVMVAPSPFSPAVVGPSPTAATY